MRPEACVVTLAEPISWGVTMEIARNHDNPSSVSHAESSVGETHPVLFQLLQQAELELILQELDELIESEGGILIP
jgi:hypothetical protein